MALFSATPSKQGLYDPNFEHDACGVAMVATLNRTSTHEIVSKGLEALRNLEHRGASGAEVNSGDGAGILVRQPDGFFRKVLTFKLPESGKYAAGLVFLPKDFAAKARVEAIAKEEGLTILGWRDLPTNSSSLGATALSVMPKFEQIFVSAVDGSADLDLDRKAFCFRKRAEHELSLYFPSLSSRTIVYKGMLIPAQVGTYYKDLSDPRMTSALALVHQRFSTNTFPTWDLAQIGRAHV